MPQSGIFIVNIFKILRVSFVFQQKPSSPQEKGLGEGFPWQIDGETMGTVTDLILGGSKITEDGLTAAIKLKTLGRKAITKLDSILKSRDITLPPKVCLVKALVFPVVMYGCESWTLL